MVRFKSTVKCVFSKVLNVQLLRREPTVHADLRSRASHGGRQLCVEHCTAQLQRKAHLTRYPQPRGTSRSDTLSTGYMSSASLQLARSPECTSRQCITPMPEVLVARWCTVPSRRSRKPIDTQRTCLLFAQGAGPSGSSHTVMRSGHQTHTAQSFTGVGRMLLASVCVKVRSVPFKGGVSHRPSGAWIAGYSPESLCRAVRLSGTNPRTGRPSNSTRLLFNGGCRYYSELTFECFRVGLRRCGDLLGHERLSFLLLEFIYVMIWRRTVVAATVSSCCCCGNSFA